MVEATRNLARLYDERASWSEVQPTRSPRLNWRMSAKTRLRESPTAAGEEVATAARPMPDSLRIQPCERLAFTQLKHLGNAVQLCSPWMHLARLPLVDGQG